MKPLHVFCGYDDREHLAWLVCRNSLEMPIRGTNDRVVIVHPLSHRDLRRQGLFYREWKIDRDGQYWDLHDGRPFSTAFSHTRFIVPALAKRLGLDGHVMFVDCDFLFLDPVTDILKEIDATKPISVVKHVWDKANCSKMEGLVQQAYPRKLWSSLMIWNLDHPTALSCDVQHVNHSTGTELHGLVQYTDDQVGSIHERWNWIPGHSSSDIEPSAVHYSLGGPWLPEFQNVAHYNTWRRKLECALETDGLNQLYPIL